MTPTYGTCDLCGMFGPLVARIGPADPMDVCIGCREDVAVAVLPDWPVLLTDLETFALS